VKVKQMPFARWMGRPWWRIYPQETVHQ